MPSAKIVGKVAGGYPASTSCTTVERADTVVDPVTLIVSASKTRPELGCSSSPTISILLGKRCIRNVLQPPILTSERKTTSRLKRGVNKAARTMTPHLSH